MATLGHPGDLCSFVRLRVRGRLMRWCVLGHRGEYVHVKGGEKVTWKFQRACQRFLRRMVSMMELSSSVVVPLLLVVVHEAKKLADAHVVCLRGGGWVSGVEGSGSRQVPNGGRLLWILVFFFFCLQP